MSTKATNTVADLLAAQVALLEAPDYSAAERRAHRERNRIVKAMTPAEKRRASAIAVATLRLCTA